MSGPLQTISQALDEHCDKLYPEQARAITRALRDAGWVIVHAKVLERTIANAAEHVNCVMAKQVATGGNDGSHT